MRRPRTVLVVALLVAASGCGDDGGGDGDDGADAVSPIPTSPLPGPDAAFPDALLQGVLATDGECFWVEPPGAARVDVVWPHGHAADFDADPAQLLGPGGRVVAVAGDRIAVGGGFFVGDADDGDCSTSPEGPFIANPDVTNCTRGGAADPLCR